jgi:hypothetical protein
VVDGAIALPDATHDADLCALAWARAIAVDAWWGAK